MLVEEAIAGPSTQYSVLVIAGGLEGYGRYGVLVKFQVSTTQRDVAGTPGIVLAVQVSHGRNP